MTVRWGNYFAPLPDRLRLTWTATPGGSTCTPSTAGDAPAQVAERRGNEQAAGCAQADLARLEGELDRLRRRAASADGSAAGPDPEDVSNRAGIRVGGIENLAPAPARAPVRAPAPAPRIGPPRPPGAPELPQLPPAFGGRSGLI